MICARLNIVCCVYLLLLIISTMVHAKCSVLVDLITMVQQQYILYRLTMVGMVAWSTPTVASQLRDYRSNTSN